MQILPNFSSEECYKRQLYFQPHDGIISNNFHLQNYHLKRNRERQKTIELQKVMMRQPKKKSIIITKQTPQRDRVIVDG